MKTSALSALRHIPLCLALLGASAALLNSPGAQAHPLGAQGDYFLYQVEPGDTLEALARHYTLNPANWRVLQTLNQVADPYRMPIALILRMPLDLIPRQPAHATVTHLNGTVTRNGQTLQTGDRLETGDTLRSGPGSVTLTLEDHSLLTIAPDTEVQVRNLQTFRGSGLSDTVLGLPQGSVESSVAPDDTGVGRFEIRTPATVTGVRGTQLRVHADASGSRHEVLSGQAAIQNTARAEQVLANSYGAAYDASGTLQGTQALLPAPRIHPATPDTASLAWDPVPGAAAYRVRIALDAAGTQQLSTQRVTQTQIALAHTQAGSRYAFVRAINALDIEGSDASLRLQGSGGLLSSDDRPVLSSNGEPVRLNNH
ncbi:MAG: FecR domain-containing protein [Castellaniella sp.]|uniref:FecR family protein n=1 Tax=Castellaniella sp. TaxID=1955812 RepID=UPI003C73B2DE